MLEQREDPSLLDEPADDARRAVLHQLDRDALLELTVSTLAEEHAAHPAAADLAHDAERADASGRRACDRLRRLEERRREARRWRLEEALRAVVGPQQLDDLRAQLRIVGARLLDVRHL